VGWGRSSGRGENRGSRHVPNGDGVELRINWQYLWAILFWLAIALGYLWNLYIIGVSKSWGELVAYFPSCLPGHRGLGIFLAVPGNYTEGPFL
jgi:hypothetical protein